MNCTATTRLTAEECLARLDALRPMPRGLRLEAYAEDNHGIPWCGNRNPLWLDLFDGDGIPHRVSKKNEVAWPDPKVIRAYAAPVRRLREERRALKDAISKAWWDGRKCRVCGEGMRCRNGCGIRCSGEERHYMGDHGSLTCLECGAPRCEP